MDDRTCPHCGHDVASTETAPEGKSKFHALRFLFFLVTMTVVVCALWKAAGWLPIPLIVVAALLFWRTRRAKFAFRPGFVVGLAFGWFMVSREPLAGDKTIRILFLCVLCGTLLAGVNAIFQGEHRRSGVAAIVAVVAYLAILAAFGF
jgi:hypothetical protein